jgi:microcystin-dependent protein
MTDISKNWYDLSLSSNILNRTYINGFIDVSNNIVGRENLWIENNHNVGDTRLGLGTVDPSFMIDIITTNPIIRFTNSSITTATQTSKNLGTINMNSPSNHNVTTSIIKCRNIDVDYDDHGSLIFSTDGGNENNAADRMVIHSDVVTFGVSSTGSFTNYTNSHEECRVHGDKVTCDNILGYGSVPIGGIIMWSNSTLISDSPIINGVHYTNWKICDGGTYNGITTPDLRNRFIVGSGDVYSIGNKGGADTVTLQTKHLPSHTHTVESGGSHTHTVRVGAVQHQVWDDSVTTAGTDDRTGGSVLSKDLLYEADWSHTHSIGNTGSGGAHENRPPFYGVYFLMRVA